MGNNANRSNRMAPAPLYSTTRLMRCAYGLQHPTGLLDHLGAAAIQARSAARGPPPSESLHSLQATCVDLILRKSPVGAAITTDDHRICAPTGVYLQLAARSTSVYTWTMSQTRPDFLSLSVAERIQLAEDIWDSIAAESPDSATLTIAQLQAIEMRLQAHDQDPTTAVAWDQVRSELFQRSH